MSSDTSDRSPPDHPPPPGAWPAVRSAARRLLSPVERFLAIEAASGIVLLAAAVIALAWANSPWHGSYEALCTRRSAFAPAGSRSSAICTSGSTTA